jgi:hypothetical protein
MKQLQELRNEILTLRNYGVINKEEQKSLLAKLNSVKEQFAICGVVKSLPSIKERDIELNDMLDCYYSVNEIQPRKDFKFAFKHCYKWINDKMTN